MKTKLPLATIAYDEDVLCKTLVDQYNKGIVSFFVYIKHYGEGDGSSEMKDHFHVYVEFNSGIDPMEFRYLFRNRVNNVTCLNFRRSQFVDWFYYCLHDPDYLASKGLKRQFIYERSGMVTIDDRELDRLISENPLPNQTRLRSALLNGVSEKEMFMQGLLNPVNVNGVTALSTILNPKLK